MHYKGTRIAIVRYKMRPACQSGAGIPHQALECRGSFVPREPPRLAPVLGNNLTYCCGLSPSLGGDRVQA